MTLAFVLLDFQQKSVGYEMECRHVSRKVSRTRTTDSTVHIQATLHLTCSEMGSQ